ncbi:lytic transglycosylase domain-containing protein [Kineococcus sp. SYSU DK003]|uniref:lytic transglycosylase domain-containing protein n=1 Tax=Kineococcus sp. SYSU DK003 TaxID=3383124 RepID=UPI003D7D2915
MRTRPRAAPTRLVGAALLLGLTGPWLATPTASADPTTAAQARARAAAAQQAAQEAAQAVARAQEELTRSTEAVSAAVSDSIRSQVRAEAAAAAAQDARTASTRRVRSIYMDAGTDGARRGLALLTSAVGGGDPAVSVRAFAAARRTDDTAQRGAQQLAQTQQVAAERAGTGAVEAVAGLRDVAARVTAMDEALAAAQAQVQSLTGEAARLQAAEEAAAALAAARAQAASVNSTVADRAAGVHARSVPADYAELYRAGARTCAGMRPALLAAVGQVESGHGVDVGPSSAGAQGPMQFMPATFAAYGVDGDGDGRADVLNAADAVFSAANYLCANGAGHGRQAEADALFRYNRADWYVAMVQRVADELEAQGS